MLSKYRSWLFPVGFFLLLAPLTPWLDWTLASYFDQLSQDPDSHFVKNSFTEAFFEYGVIPAEIAAVMASLFFALSYFSPFWKRFREATLVLILTMAVGEGFLVHVVFKDQWGRPRPKQVEQFGGKQEFRPFYKPNFFNQPEPSKSFPCGHCGMGYYFLTFTVIGMRYGIRWMKYGGLIVGLTLGSVMGGVRMAQGGHFFSDVLFAGLLIWLTALSFDWLIHDEKEKSLYRRLIS